MNIDDKYRQAATYIDRVLRGEKPGDLPAQQANNYEFIINLKTAQTLGLEISSELLSVAEKLIE